MPRRDIGTVFSTGETLRGLAPSLIVELAKLSGSTLSDLKVTMQLMPYGDRAVLQAYDLIVLGSDAKRVPRTIDEVRPAILEVIAAAAYLVATVAERHLDEIVAELETMSDY